MLFDLFTVEDLRDSVADHFDGSFKSFHVRVGPSKFNVVEDAPVKVFNCGQDEVVVEAKHVKGKELSCFFCESCEPHFGADFEDDDC